MKKDIEKNEFENMDPYAIDKLHKVPFWIKVLILKYWFFGAINFFMLMGIGSSDGNSDYWQWMAIFCGLIGGAFYDFVINKIIMLWETDKHEGKYFSMIISKKYYAMIINIIYFVFLFINVYLVQNALGDFFHKTLKWNYTPGQEPFSFGLIVLGIDAFYLLIKNGIVYLIKKLRNKNIDE